jgi:hypothetical protein
MPRDFSGLQREIEEIVARLKATTDPFIRRDLLKELRRLTGEADRAIDLGKKPSKNSN